MPGGIADYGTEQWLGQLFGLVATPSQYFIALLTAEPGPGMDGDIISELEPDPTAGYGRRSIGYGADYWMLNGSILTNQATLDYGIPTDDWGILTHWAMTSAADSGSLYSWGEFLNPVAATTSQQIVLPPGGITISLHSLEDSIAV